MRPAGVIEGKYRVITQPGPEAVIDGYVGLMTASDPKEN
jgi:hypothetical protein